MGLGPTVASLSLGGQADFRFRMRSGWQHHPECHLPGQDVSSNKTPVLHLVLNHGDILIMDGEGVQKYWEVGYYDKSYSVVKLISIIRHHSMNATSKVSSGLLRPLDL